MNMNSSYLVQRLEQPRNFDNPFSFGGGFKNGGLNDDAMELLRPIFSFDYMGAAEFEFGAVPKALQAIGKQAEADNLFGWSFPVTKAYIKNEKGRYGVTSIDPVLIYAIAPIDWQDEVEARVRNWSTDPYGGLKESTHLDRALVGEGDVVGWLELDNGFMFFTDKEMYDKVFDLFEAVTIDD